MRIPLMARWPAVRRGQSSLSEQNLSIVSVFPIELGSAITLEGRSQERKSEAAEAHSIVPMTGGSATASAALSFSKQSSRGWLPLTRQPAITKMRRARQTGKSPLTGNTLAGPLLVARAGVFGAVYLTHTSIAAHRIWYKNLRVSNTIITSGVARRNPASFARRRRLF